MSSYDNFLSVSAPIATIAYTHQCHQAALGQGTSVLFGPPALLLQQLHTSMSLGSSRTGNNYLGMLITILDLSQLISVVLMLVGHPGNTKLTRPNILYKANLVKLHCSTVFFPSLK